MDLWFPQVAKKRNNRNETHIYRNVISTIRLLHTDKRIAFGNDERRYADHSADLRFLFIRQRSKSFEAGDSAVGVEDWDDGFGATGDGVDDGGLHC